MTRFLILSLWFMAGAVAANPYGSSDRLDRAIAAYEQLARSGGWQPLTSGDLLRPGDSGRRVDALVRRLATSGELESEDHADYDEAVQTAVRLFQQRHGLAVDGLVGPNTLAALNVSVEQRLQQMRANRDRMKELESNLESDTYVLVNLPDYRLYRVRGGEPAYNMRVVIGQEGWDTPTMHDQIEELVANPYWNVPASIVAADIAPKMVDNPEYLEENHMQVLEGSFEGEPVDPSTIDWAAVTEDNFAYFVRQLPGPENPLGEIKFRFPNEELIYLHDTPHQQLFELTDRQESHGCIRLSEPLRLARDLVDDDRRLTAALDKDQPETLPLEKPEPIHLVYFTAWVADDGTIHFRQDIYGRDDPSAKPEEADAASLTG